MTGLNKHARDRTQNQASPEKIARLLALAGCRATIFVGPPPTEQALMRISFLGSGLFASLLPLAFLSLKHSASQCMTQGDTK